MIMKRKVKIIISGGGTGGHVFPAISIANALKEINPEADILFVGANGKIEMEKVPEAGYNIIGLPIKGFERKYLLTNITRIFRLFESLLKAFSIIKKFKPDVVVGVGGYASGPVLKIAQRLNIPTVIQEQNSYAGVTNRLLAKKAVKICVAYDNMDKYFPPEKIVFTGNPVRNNIINNSISKNEAFEFFNLNPEQKTVLVIGGSLGAKTINSSIEKNIDIFISSNIQVLWQTGKLYYNDIITKYGYLKNKGIMIYDFINRMDMAYLVANIIISRAGAGTISELCIIGKAVILVPSPNVAEDHQSKNAMALVNKNAAIMVKDNEAENLLADVALSLINNNEKMKIISENIRKLAIFDSSSRIANEILNLVK
jgi:UDP-N-acetylglucosamine--N-acetylmuramyl-(pentapeptide) pyrophosphoryl-undecaprenol N-acetylglucosamine transferase